MCLLTVGCGDGSRSGTLPSDQSKRVTIRQGLWGEVWFSQGNLQPSTSPTNGTVRAAKRTVLIYEPTLRTQATPATDQASINHPFAFYSAVSTKLVATAQSDDKGFFQVELPPGEYSVFVQENGLLYANSSAVIGVSSAGNLSGISVSANTVSQILFNINYLAAY